jgi:hypothetical protein
MFNSCLRIPFPFSADLGGAAPLADGGKGRVAVHLPVAKQTSEAAISIIVDHRERATQVAP